MILRTFGPWLIVFALAACGGSPTAPTPPPPTAANVTVKILTSPIIPVPIFPPLTAEIQLPVAPDYWVIAFSIQVAETAGIGGPLGTTECTWRNESGQVIGWSIGSVTSGWMMTKRGPRVSACSVSLHRRVSRSR